MTRLGGPEGAAKNRVGDADLAVTALGAGVSGAAYGTRTAARGRALAGVLPRRDNVRAATTAVSVGLAVPSGLAVGADRAARTAPGARGAAGRRHRRGR